MSALPKPASAVYFAEDVCERLQISRSTLKRLRRADAFPIPELPPLDKRPRWSIAEVEAFIATKRKVARERRAWTKRHAPTVIRISSVSKTTSRERNGGVR